MITRRYMTVLNLKFSSVSLSVRAFCQWLSLLGWLTGGLSWEVVNRDDTIPEVK